MPWRLLLPVALISFALGGLFGSTEVVTVAFADSLGDKAIAGVLLALWALGSLVAGVITGAVTVAEPRPATRMRLGVVALTALMAPTPLIGELGGDGRAAVPRRLRDRADPDRRGLLHRADGAGEPAHRGHRDPAHRRWPPGIAPGRRRRRRRSSTHTAPHAAYLVPLALRAPRRRWPPSATRGGPVNRLARVSTWTNWSRLETAEPTREATPADAGDVVAEVRRALETASTVKMVGTGHSFTAISAPEATMLRPERPHRGRRRRPRRDDGHRPGRHPAEGAQRATSSALGLSLHNMGDIAEQTLAGAISTGTHGTGGTAAGLAAQVVGLELVTGTGELLRATADENPDVLDVARVGLGALGILTTITFRVEPIFVLEAHGAADVVGRGARRLRRHDRGGRPRRHVLVPAHRPDADQAQHTAAGPTCRGASRCPAAGRGSTTSSCRTPRSACSPPAPTGCPA